MTRVTQAGRRVAQDLQSRFRGAGSRRGRSFAITLLTPIVPGKTSELGRVLRSFGSGEDSPLALLPDVHFARWVVIDRLNTDWPRPPRRLSRLASDYLLFTADLSVHGHEDYTLPDWFLRQLIVRIPDEAHRVWGRCVGYPGVSDADGCVRYLIESQVEASLYYVGYPDVSVHEVCRALAARKGLIDFARRHQGPADPRELQQAYLEGARQWFD